jgi:hypothetical protein
MGLFQRHAAPDAYDMVYGGRRPHHEITHELLAAAVGFEVMRMYEHHLRREGLAPHHALAKELLAGFVAAEIDRHFDRGHYGHLSRHQARRLAQEQADYLWRRQYGRLFGPEGEGGAGLGRPQGGANGTGDGDDEARQGEQHQLHR